MHQGAQGIWGWSWSNTHVVCGAAADGSGDAYGQPRDEEETYEADCFEASFSGRRKISADDERTTT